jgi:hypothetical protein
MKSDLAIATIIRSRMTELGLSRGEFAKRLGYKNIAKGIRRIDVLCEGDIDGTKHFLDVLPQALETSAETVMAERGMSLARTTIMRWIQRYVPDFETCWNRFACRAGASGESMKPM